MSEWGAVDIIHPFPLIEVCVCVCVCVCEGVGERVRERERERECESVWGWVGVCGEWVAVNVVRGREHV